MKEKARVLDSQAISRSLSRIAHEILEHNRGTDNLAIVGIRSRGPIWPRDWPSAFGK